MDLGDSEDYLPIAAGILVTPHKLSRGDVGTVVVGASFQHSTHATE